METLTTANAKDVLEAYNNRKKKGKSPNIEALKKVIAWGTKAKTKETFSVSPDDCMVFQRVKGSKKEPYNRVELLKRGYNAFRKHIEEDYPELDIKRIWMEKSENKFWADYANLVKLLH